MATVDMIEKFNKAFKRNDLGSFCLLKKNDGAIFDKIIKDYIHPYTGEKYAIHLTNDPIKMLGCGFRIKSSYSPSSPSFMYLPTFVLQDYIGMLYITDGTTIVKDINGIEFEAPNYIARAFVMINPDSHYILCKMPTYYTPSDKSLWYCFEDVKEKGFGVCKTKTFAPEIHLDCLDLFYADLHSGQKPQAHIAVCGVKQPCFEWYKNKGYMI
jgi:hypothetical protein